MSGKSLDEILKKIEADRQQKLLNEKSEEDKLYKERERQSKYIREQRRMFESIAPSSSSSAAGAGAGGTKPIPPTPIITQIVTGIDFGQVFYGDDTIIETYTISGSNLLENIHIAVGDSTGGFYINTSGDPDDLNEELDLTQVNGSVAITTIYVIYTIASSGSFSTTISHTTSGATTNSLSLTGVSIGAPTMSATTNPSNLTEHNFNGSVITLNLSNDTFVLIVNSSNLQLENAPSASYIVGLNRISDTVLEVTIDYDHTNFDVDITNFKVSIDGTELTRGIGLSTQDITITAISPGILTVTSGDALTEGTLNEATLTLTLQNDTFSFSTSGSDITVNDCPGLIVASVLINFGNPTLAQILLSFNGTSFSGIDKDITFTVAGNKLAGGNPLTSDTIHITALAGGDPSVVATTNPSNLTETNFDGSVVTLTITNDTFIAVVRSYNLHLENAPSFSFIDSINRVSDTVLEVTINYDGADFDTDKTDFRIIIDGTELTSGDGLTTDNITVEAVVETVSPVLDANTGAIAAYSLRKLRTAFAGSPIRVRRSSDNTQVDIGFVGNDLDTATLLTFCGVGNGTITKWYDQSGTRDITISLNNPTIVSSGVLVTENGKPALTWANTTANIPTTTAFAGTLPDIYFVGRSDSESYSIFKRNSTVINWQLSQNKAVIQNTALSGLTGIFNEEMQRLVNLFVGPGNAKTVSYNDSTFSSTLVAPSTIPGTTSAYGICPSFTGTVQEFIIWTSDQVANRSSIKSNIKSYYSITSNPVAIIPTEIIFGENSASINFGGLPYMNFPKRWIHPEFSDSDDNYNWFIYNDTNLIPQCDVVDSSGDSYLMSIDAYQFSVGEGIFLGLPVISTIGKSNITFNVNQYRIPSAPTTMLKWSTDGITYNDVTFTDVASDSEWHPATPVVLPSSCDNQVLLYLQIGITSSGVNAAIAESPISGFTGLLADSLWTTHEDTTINSIISISPTTISIVSGDDGSETQGTSYVSIARVTNVGSISFDWAVDTTDDTDISTMIQIGFDATFFAQFYTSLDGLVDGGGTTQTGSMVFPLVDYNGEFTLIPINIYVFNNTRNDGVYQNTLTITNFTFIPYSWGGPSSAFDDIRITGT